MGQLDPALACYRKSALAVEKLPLSDYLRNEGFIRTWIGELLAAKGDVRWAATFFSAARAKWEQVSPPKVMKIAALERELRDRLEGWHVNEGQTEGLCLNWILGRPSQL
jgi:hypothetical protein